jgi:hypothetical protein
MNVYLILVIIALNVGYYYLTDWLGKKDLPKPEPHQTLINLTSLHLTRFHFFFVTTGALLILSAGKIDTFGLLAFSLFVLFGLGVNFGLFLNPNCRYLLFDDKLIIVKKSLMTSPETFDWQSLQKFDAPSLISGKGMPKKTVLTSYDSFDYPFAQDFLFDWFYFDKKTHEALKVFHQRVLEAIEINKNTEEF